MLMILPPLRAAIPFATRMGHLERSELVDGANLLPELLARLEKRHRRVPAGVVHQDVRAGARGVLEGLHGPDDGRVVRDVAGLGDRAPFAGFDPANRVARSIRANVKHPDHRALLGQPLTDRAPNSAATPGYDRRLSLESPHALHLVQCRVG